MGSAHSAALESAKKGDVEAIKKLLQRSDVKEWLNMADKNGKTPLHKASARGRLEVVKLLLSAGAFVDVFTVFGYSAIGVAFRYGHFSVMDVFIAMELKGYLYYQRGDGGSLLHVVCKESEIEMDLVKRLLDRGLDPAQTDKHEKQPVDYVSDEKKAEVSRLFCFHSAEKGDVKAVMKLLERSDVKEWLNNGDKDIGYTPLHAASIKGHLEVAKLLLASGADINCTNRYGYTPLHEASIKGHLEMVKLLLSARAYVDIIETNYGQSAIGMASRNGHASVVDVFIDMELKGQLCYQGDDGGSLFHVVCKEKMSKMDLVKRLLEGGLDVFKRDKNGKRPKDYISDEKKKSEMSRIVSKWTPEVIKNFERAKQERQRVEAEKKEQEREVREKEEDAAVAAYHREADGLKLEADGAMESGEVEKAVSLYSQCISMDSTSPVAMAALGNRSLAFLKLKMYDKAISDASAVLSHDPRKVEILYQRAMAYEGASRFDKAIDNLDEILSIRPGHELAAEAHSRVTQIISERPDASKDLKTPDKKELTTHVSESLELKKLGYNSFREGDYDTAVKHYSEAIRLDSSNASLYSNRAEAYLKNADYVNAEVDASHVISSGDRDGLLNAYYHRALARQGINTTESLQGALGDINHLISSDPENKAAASEKQKIENALLQVEAKKEEAAAARLREAEAQVLMEREMHDLVMERLFSPDSDDREQLLIQQQRQGAAIAHVREMLNSIDDKLKCLSPVDREEQRLIRTTPVLSEYMQALQRHTHESLLIADALSAGLLDQTANLESDALEVKAFSVLANLCSGLPLIPAVLSGVAGGLNLLYQAKEKGGYSLLLKLVSGDPVERSLFVEKLSRALTVTLRNEIIATDSARHNTDAMESTRCLLAKVKGAMRKMKTVAREKVAAVDAALAEGLLPTETKAELLACGHVTNLLEYVFGGGLEGVKYDEEEVVNRLVGHVAGSERVRLQVSTQVEVSSSISTSPVEPSHQSTGGSHQLDLNLTGSLKCQTNERGDIIDHDDIARRAEVEELKLMIAELMKENKRIGEKAERSEQTMNRVFQHVVTGDGQQVKSSIQTRRGVTIEVIDSQAELRLTEVSTAQLSTEEVVQSLLEEVQFLRDKVTKLEKNK